MGSRRAFIAGAAGAAALLPVHGTALAAPTPEPAPAAAGKTNQALTLGYTLLGPEEAAFVEALVNVMCPADALTPNGTECGLAIYIDRQLAGDFGKGGRMYSHGPWMPGQAAAGLSAAAKARRVLQGGHRGGDAARRKRASAKRSMQLAPADADAFLQDIAAGKVTDARLSLADWFSQLVYPLFQQACFADPSTAAIATRCSGS